MGYAILWAAMILINDQGICLYSAGMIRFQIAIQMQFAESFADPCSVLAVLHANAP
jgi:hypothetical protein